MDSSVYNELNKAWKATCRILFGEEIGELREYEEWLKEYMLPMKKRKSQVSGREVAIAIGEYCETAKFVSLAESREKAIEALSVNEIKDIDSILEAISERWEYVGDRVLGNSKFVEGSDLVVDSHYVADSIDIQSSSHVFSSSMVELNCKQVFGCLRVTPSSEVIVRCLRVGHLNRCFECYCVDPLSDAYFCSSIMGGHDLMFCFNLRNKTHCIGNLQLDRERYFSLKKKLVEEIKDELRKNKRFPSLFEIVPNTKPSEKVELSIKEKEKGNLKPIEQAFSSTFRTIFKREPGSLMDYESWLTEHTAKPKPVKTPFGSIAYILDEKYFPIYSKMPVQRVVSFEEAEELGGLQLSESDITSLQKLKDSLGKISYITDEWSSGTIHNVTGTATRLDSANIYKVEAALNSEYSALGSMVWYSKYVFGCRITASQFCINCYNSFNLNRCFELDSSSNCSDAYFAHNCEGLQDAMFCWNTKGKRHAIGNTELSPEQYRKIKDTLVSQMADEILNKKELKWDIYNIGCAGAKSD
jgi:hypothetical protein